MKFVRLLNDQGQSYGSYTDYWRLVELSGFQSCAAEEIQPDSDETYILSPPNGNAHAIASQTRRCRMICWMLERPTGGLPGFIPQMYDSVWLSDRWLADQFRDDPKARFVPIGGHPNLGGEKKDIVWDITHQAYVYGRRQRILHDLLIAGYKIGPACWGAERDEQLASSRVGLCMHQDSLKLVEPLRYTLFSCWGLPLVTEENHCAWPYRTYTLTEIDAASDGETNRRLLTEDLTFRKCVESAL